MKTLFNHFDLAIQYLAGITWLATIFALMTIAPFKVALTFCILGAFIAFGYALVVLFTDWI